MPPPNITTPASSQGTGFRCSSHPLDDAVCQQVVPGPARCTHATYSSRAPAPLSRPSAERRIVGRDAIRAPATTTGPSSSTPSDTAPRAAANPRSAHAQNHPQPVTCARSAARKVAVPALPRSISAAVAADARDLDAVVGHDEAVPRRHLVDPTVDALLDLDDPVAVRTEQVMVVRVGAQPVAELRAVM
jgi:hypothetical protein